MMIRPGNKIKVTEVLDGSIGVKIDDVYVVTRVYDDHEGVVCPYQLHDGINPKDVFGWVDGVKVDQSTPITSPGPEKLNTTDEVRVIDPDTGGEKGTKLEQFAYLPTGPMETVARVYGLGAQKYQPRNWEKGYAWSLSYSAMQRHLHAFWGGEDNDPESGEPHLAHVVFHALAMMEFMNTHPEKDDRSGSRYRA